MPKKKDVLPTPPVAEENLTVPSIGEEKTEPVAPQPAASKKCGHVNLHSLGVDGKPDKPVCILDKGHTGDHYAKHQMQVEDRKIYDQIYGKHIDTIYKIVEAEAYWGDLAGVPLSEIKVGPLPSRNKKSDILQEIERLAK